MLDRTEADTVHSFQGGQKQVIILPPSWTIPGAAVPASRSPTIRNWSSRRLARDPAFHPGHQLDMLPRSRHIRDLVGYIGYHSPGEEVPDSVVISVFDLLYRDYSQPLRPLAARLRKELKYPSEDIIWTVLHEILAEQRYAHLDGQLPGAGQEPHAGHRHTHPAQKSTSTTGIGRLRRLQPGHQQPLLAIEVDGFSTTRQSGSWPATRSRTVLSAHRGLPLLAAADPPAAGRTDSIRQALDDAETHWARLSTR